MTSSYANPVGPVAWPDGHHPSDDLLASYARGAVDRLALWSVEAHLTGCAECRSALSGQVDAGRLARNRSVVMVRTALPRAAGPRRLLSRCGAPDYLLDLLAATPSLRRSWLLSVVGVLAVVAAEAAIVGHGWIPGRAHPGEAGSDPAAMAPFVLVAPLLVLAGVTAAFLPLFDPAARLAVAAPFSAIRLLLVRTVAALLAALVPVAGAAAFVPGPGWLPVALLLPSLALCAFALAAVTVLGPRAAAVTAAGLWALPTVFLAASRVPLLIVQHGAQMTCAAVLCASLLVLYLRRGRFELGWTR
jgi:Putative zinc-finger